MNKQLLISLFIILGLLQSTSCDFQKIKSEATTGELFIVADDIVEPLVIALNNEFVRLNTEASIKSEFTPTKNAIADIINGKTKNIIIPRDFIEEENEYAKQNGLTLTKYPVAIDGIGFIVNPKNPAERLTSEDLKNILSGKYKKWTDIKTQDEKQNDRILKEMKGSENNIKIFIHRPNSYLYEYVKDSVLLGENYTNTSKICSTSVQMLEEVRTYRNSIGISNLSWLSAGDYDKLDTTVKTLRIYKNNPPTGERIFAELHQGLISNQTYPYRIVINYYTTELGLNISTGYITFLRNKDGQTIVLKEGLVPVTQIIRYIQLN
ncbi:MAG: hypothetical protein FJ216_09370 [Ignavibacteria bacterium]|nr:hypothetical protein [Ignavibacteria bacterium]